MGYSEHVERRLRTVIVDSPMNARLIVEGEDVETSDRELIAFLFDVVQVLQQELKLTAQMLDTLAAEVGISLDVDHD